MQHDSSMPALGKNKKLDDSPQIKPKKGSKELRLRQNLDLGSRENSIQVLDSALSSENGPDSPVTRELDFDVRGSLSNKNDKITAD